MRQTIGQMTVNPTKLTSRSGGTQEEAVRLAEPSSAFCYGTRPEMPPINAGVVAYLQLGRCPGGGSSVAGPQQRRPEVERRPLVQLHHAELQVKLEAS